MQKSHILKIIRILSGFVFVISAILKLFPAEILEIAIVETGIIGWTLAPFAARLLIAFELFLGIMLISGLYKTFFIRISLLTLAAFTIYLAILLITQGNSGNCNCFGMLLPMTPLESIIKNMVLILLLLYLLKNVSPHKWRFSLAFLISCIVVSTAASFALAPIVVSSYRPNSKLLNHPLELDLIYGDETAVKPQEDVRKGRWVVAFLSSSCTQCRIAGYRFHVIKKNVPEIPFYFFINGTDKGIEEFLEQTRSGNIPHSKIKASTILKVAGSNLPAIFWIDEGVIVNRTSLYSVNENNVMEWKNLP